MNEIEEVDEFQEPTTTSCPKCGTHLDYQSFSQMNDESVCKCGVPIKYYTQEYHSKGK